jgi:hypothetical protein
VGLSLLLFSISVFQPPARACGALEEEFGRNVEAAAEVFDVVFVELAFAVQDFGDDPGSAAERECVPRLRRLGWFLFCCPALSGWANLWCAYGAQHTEIGKEKMQS